MAATPFANSKSSAQVSGYILLQRGLSIRGVLECLTIQKADLGFRALQVGRSHLHRRSSKSKSRNNATQADLTFIYDGPNARPKFSARDPGTNSIGPHRLGGISRHDDSSNRSDRFRAGGRGNTLFYSR